MSAAKQHARTVIALFESELDNRAAEEGFKILDLLGRLSRPLREFAHLLSDHRKALTHLPGPRSLNTGIQRQQISLESNLIDDADDAGDLVDDRSMRSRLGSGTR
jgi:hypothetical protein